MVIVDADEVIWLHRAEVDAERPHTHPTHDAQFAVPPRHEHLGRGVCARPRRAWRIGRRKST
jgi:hypothetical protein